MKIFTKYPAPSFWACQYGSVTYFGLIGPYFLEKNDTTMPVNVEP